MKIFLKILIFSLSLAFLSPLWADDGTTGVIVRCQDQDDLDRPWLLCETIIIDDKFVDPDALSPEELAALERFQNDAAVPFKSYNLMNASVSGAFSPAGSDGVAGLRAETGFFEFFGSRLRIDEGRLTYLYGKNESYYFVKIPTLEVNTFRTSTGIKKFQYADYLTLLLPMYHSFSNDHSFIRIYGVRLGFAGRELNSLKELAWGYHWDVTLERGTIDFFNRGNAIPSTLLQAKIETFFNIHDDFYVGFKTRWNFFTLEYPLNSNAFQIYNVKIHGDNEVFFSKNWLANGFILSPRVGYNFIYEKPVNNQPQKFIHNIFLGFSF
jgi:hypothetical protein